MAYSPSNASTFNQLTQQGLGVTDASTQSGVSTNPGAYGYGTNANLGAVIPGAGGVTDAAGLTKVNYSQNYSGQPSQQVQLAMNAAEINEFTNRNSGFGVQEVSPGNFVPTLNISAEPPTGNTESYGSSTFQDPAQRAGQNALTSPQPTPSPFAAFSQVQTVPISAPAPSTFQDPAQRAAAAAAEVAPGQQTAAPDAVTPSFVQAPGEAGRGTATTAAPDAVTPSFVQAPGEAGRGVVPTTTPSNVTSPFVQAPGELGRGTAAPAAVTQSDAETARLARLDLAATPNQSAAETARLARTAQAALTESEKLLAQRQAAIAAQKRLINNNGDWRVRISLAEQSTYLYNAPQAEQGILAPLAATHGVIFPYTPKIDVGYRANYSAVDLTHSNYTNYFYNGSSVGQVRILGTFTAQDTVEAQYLLAVIHFFRSATKMFYGQDAQRGAPPPLLFVNGLGEYQFNNHPCVLTSFEYNLPADVDYIRAGSPNQNGTDLLKRRTSTQNNLPTDPISGALSRLNQLFTGQGVQKGGIVSQPAPSNFSKNSPTYVPTKIEISLGLWPIVTRNQASQQFSLKQFANGSLVKQGFW